MAMIRANHKEEGNFTQVSNALLRDTRVSSKAKLYLTLMLSFTDTWKFSVDGLRHFIKEGKSALKTGLDELVKFGYLKKIKRHISGRYDWEYTIIENPNGDPDTKQENNRKDNKTKNADTKSKTDSKPEKNNKQKNGVLNFKSLKKQSYNNTGSSNTDFNNINLKRERTANKTQQKQKFGKYENVTLTPEEYNHLVELYGKEQTDRSIESMSKYMASHNTRYNIFEKLKQWIEEDIEKFKQNNNYKQPKRKNKIHNDEDFDVDMYKCFINDIPEINENFSDFPVLEEQQEEEQRERENAEWRKKRKAEMEAERQRIISGYYKTEY